MLAAKKGSTEILTALLDRKALTDTGDNNGATLGSSTIAATRSDIASFTYGDESEGHTRI